jgi:putative SOS response-associated peptidase YedK
LGNPAAAWEQRIASGKIPMRVRMKDQKPFTMAGLWDLWRDPDGEELYSFTIITVPANKLFRAIHDRMPLILDPDVKGSGSPP